MDVGLSLLPFSFVSGYEIITYGHCLRQQHEKFVPVTQVARSLLIVQQVFARTIAVIEQRLAMSAGSFMISDMITTVFGSMARSNMQLMSFKTSPGDRQRLSADIQEFRGYFQDVHEAGARASNANPRSRAITPAIGTIATGGSRGSTSSRARASRAASSRPTSSRSSGRGISAGTPSSQSMLSQTAPFDVVESVEPLDPNRETIRADKLRSCEDRPNVHIGLHYPEQAIEYALPSVVNVLMGEDQHRCVQMTIRPVYFN